MFLLRQGDVNVFLLRGTMRQMSEWEGRRKAQMCATGDRRAVPSGLDPERKVAGHIKPLSADPVTRGKSSRPRC